MRNGRALVGWMVLLLVSAAPARAIGIGWLEKLSGPGPFGGWEVGLPILCFDLAADDRRVTEEQPRNRLGRAGFCGEYQDRAKPTVIIGFQYSDFDSQKNRLEYDPSDERDKTVKLRSYLLSIDVRVHPAVDVGVGVAVNRFSGQAFESFTSLSFDPLRITIRPVALFLPRQRAVGGKVKVSLRDLVQVKANARVYPKGFDARDFGSTGTFDQAVDVQWGVSVGIGVVLWW
jgi:hypothetical protein